MYIVISGNLLSESDIQVLALVLSEYLTNLEKSGLSLKQGERITKEEVVVQLRKINQHELAEILSKDRGKTSKMVIVKNINQIQT